MADLIKEQQAKTEDGIEKLPMPESKFLAQAEYNPKTYQLTVWLKNGAQHIYNYVYPVNWDLFKQAPNKGEYFSKAIKGKFVSLRTVNKTKGPHVSSKIKAYRMSQTMANSRNQSPV